MPDIVATMGPGQNSHHIRYLSQSDNSLCPGRKLIGKIVVAMSDICHKMIVAMFDIYCTTQSLYWRSFKDLICTPQVFSSTCNTLTRRRPRSSSSSLWWVSPCSSSSFPSASGPSRGSWRRSSWAQRSKSAPLRFPVSTVFVVLILRVENLGIVSVCASYSIGRD